MTDPRATLPRAFVTAAVALLLACHAWLAVSATLDLGVTGDETVHLTGGFSYWRFNDYRLHPENGNLPQRWAALPLLAAQPHMDPHQEPREWSRSQVWHIAHTFFFASGNTIDFLLLCARSAMVCWSVATGVLVFAWSRTLWGDRAGLFSLGLFAFSPTTLAHGALVTSDMCGAFWLLAATWSWWRLTERIDAGRLTVSLFCAAMAAVAKFSFPALVPVALLIGAARVALRHPIELSVRPHGPVRMLQRPAAKIGALAAAGAVHVIVAGAGVWAFFGFRYSAFSPELPTAVSFFAPTETILPPPGSLRWCLDHAREFRLLPEAYLQGFTYVLYAGQARNSFLAGDYGSTGWWWFFPFAFLVKSSAAELLVAFALPIVAALGWLRDRSAALHRTRELIPLIVFAAVYAAFSLTSHLNIGQRHILPLYPVLFILAGALYPRAGRVAAGFAALLLALALVASSSIRPDYLAFFNRLAGGPDNGWRLLGDSSLDWGQNLPSLARWVEAQRKPGEPVYLSYFGADDPFYRGLRVHELSPYFSPRGPLRWEPLSGGLYCIGVSMLQDASSPYRGPWNRAREERYQQLRRTAGAEVAAGSRPPVFEYGSGVNRELWELDRARFARLAAYLRARGPDTVLRHTFFIYRLTDDEVRRAVEGSFDELVEAVAATRRQAHGS